MGGGSGWATNWQWESAAVQTGRVPKVGVYRDSEGNPNMFKNPAEVGAIAPNCPSGGCAFRFAYRGESGQRNNLRGPGFFQLDSGLYKKWKVTEDQALTFSWQTFNVTNTPRFDAAQAAFNFNLTSGIFGA